MAILISTPQDLNNIRNNLTGDYELANEIDMSGFGNFIPISKSSPYFTGTFDGKGHKIKNLTINETTGYVGLFGLINNSTTTIKNVGVENCNISGGNVANWAGAIVGQLMSGSIKNCWSTGQIVGKYMIGGIVGQFTGGKVKNCYSATNITGFGRVGGLVGYIGSSSATVENCYSTGIATATETGTAYPVGGLIGDNAGTGNVTNSYWDMEASGLTISEGGTGKTTAEMQTQSTYTNWDFSTTWGINGDYPYLQVFGVPAAPPRIETITVNSYSNLIKSDVNKYARVSKVTESFLSQIFLNIIRKSQTQRNVSTYLSPIVANVQKSNRTVRNSTQNVHSFIRPIGSSVYRESKTVKNLLSYIKPIQARTDVLYPLNILIPTAYVNVQENDSVAYKMENMSTISYMDNPSYVEVMK